MPFEIKILATNWGFAGSLPQYFDKVKQEGYDGIEIFAPLQNEEAEILFGLLKRYQLQVGFLCGAYFRGSAAEQFDHFKTMVDAAAYNTYQKPLYINCHSGKDYFSFEQNKMFIDYGIEVSEKTGITVCHETHRSRILYSAPVTKYYMEQIADFKITLDASHWCNVSESLLDDQEHTMEKVLAQTDHIHARIGHAQGPQVNDPRAPEWKDAMEAHLQWWDKVVAIKKKNNQPLTFLTEFGPPDYLPVMPYTKQPLANQWEINVYMMQLLKKRYKLNN